jgi:hypothetical protein
MPWKPANAVHAIDRALIKFEFGALPTKAFEKVFSLVKSASEPYDFTDIVSVQNAQAFHIVADADGTNLVPQPGVTSRRLRRLDTDGNVIEEIICSPSFLAFSISRYESWASIASKMPPCLSAAVSYIQEDIHNVDAVRLEYWDRFVQEVDGDEALLNPNTKLIPASFEKVVGSWHSHAGFFHLEGERRTLININVDVISEIDAEANSLVASQLSEGVSALCRMYSLALVTPKSTSTFKDFDQCMEAANDAHELLKAAIGDVINPALAARIKLNAKAFQL